MCMGVHVGLAGYKHKVHREDEAHWRNHEHELPVRPRPGHDYKTSRASKASMPAVERQRTLSAGSSHLSERVNLTTGNYGTHPPTEDILRVRTILAQDEAERAAQIQAQIEHIPEERDASEQTK